MAWYLDINPTNQTGTQYVTIPSWSITGDFKIEIDCEIYNTTATGADGFAFSGGTSSGGFELYRDSGGLSFRPSIWRNNVKNFISASNIWPYVAGSTVDPRRITIQRIGNTVSSDFAGTAGTNITIATGDNIVISAIGARSGGTYTLGMRLYRMRMYQAGSLVRDYDPSASGGSGVTLTDTVSGQNGTFQNPPAANAQWVFYDAGGGGVIGVGIGSTFGDGFDFSRADALTSARQFTTGDSFDLSRLATAFAASSYSTGDGFDRVLASAQTAARNLTNGGGFDLPRLSASFLARNLTAGDGFGYGQAQFGATIIIGTGIGFTAGDGFDRSTAATGLSAQPVPTYGIPVAYANATVRASISAATVADGSCLARAAIGPANLQLGALLEPTARGMFQIDSSAYVLSSASIYTRANVSDKTDLVPIEYRRHAVTLKPKSFEAANPWTNRQFTTSGSTNTRTLFLTL